MCAFCQTEGKQASKRGRGREREKSGEGAGVGRRGERRRVSRTVREGTASCSLPRAADWVFKCVIVSAFLSCRVNKSGHCYFLFFYPSH